MSQESWPNSNSQKHRELSYFVSDGCSLIDRWKEADKYRDCCVDHDFAYWKGGTLEQKEQADVTLINCMRARGASGWTAGAFEVMLMNFGRINWGKKWIPRLPPGPLSPQDLEEIAKKKENYHGEVPIVASYNHAKICSETLVKAIETQSLLKQNKNLVCYNLVSQGGSDQIHAQIVFTEECQPGYFIHQFEAGETSKNKNETFEGFGSCADLVRPNLLGAAKTEKYYKVAPLVRDAASP